MFLAFFFGTSLCSKNFASVQLSKDAQVSVITLGPYHKELWSSWGHSVIRVYDPHQNIDWSYDYGVFSFESTDFFWNYALGKMYYSIGKSERFQAKVSAWKRRNRSVTEQVLNFTHEEVQYAFDLLETNYRPENRVYLYNYVYDNCATRIIDLIDQTTFNQTRYDDQFMTEGKKIRDLMDEGLKFQPWGDLIIDLFLGTQIDHVANQREYSMMPRYVQESFSTSTIIRNGSETPLVKDEILLYVAKPEDLKNGVFTPFNVFALLFLIIGSVTYTGFKNQSHSKWIDLSLFSLTGMIGLICCFLWLGTEHLSKNNWNVLWAIPFHLPAIWLTFYGKFRPVLVLYFRFAGMIHLVTLLCWLIIPQSLHPAVIPILIVLAVREFYLSYYLKTQRV